MEMKKEYGNIIEHFKYFKVPQMSGGVERPLTLPNPKTQLSICLVLYFRGGDDHFHDVERSVKLHFRRLLKLVHISRDRFIY